MTLSLKEKKLAEVKRVPLWWHTIDLGDGVVTPGQTSPREHELRATAIPTDLAGKTVLDVGCWDGYYSLLCEGRGALVTPIDNFQYREFVRSRYGVELQGGEGFRVAARWLDSPLRPRKRDFTQVTETFDVVLFFGVLYHQRNPLLALEHVSRLAREWAVIETHYLKSETQPILRFYPGSTFNSDPTNFWGPSLSCLELMLQEVGFRSVKLVDTWSGDDDRAIFVAEK